MTESSAERILVVPGWENSGPGHWQTLWERDRPGLVRVEMEDWNRPDRDDWVARLDAAVADGPAPVLVAHSLGCLAVAHWATGEPSRPARAALLVAPPDVEREDAPAEIAGFAPVPLRPLPFPSVLVASRTDPWTAFGRSWAIAEAWGSSFVDAGEAGHLNTDAGYGPWPEGEALLDGLLALRDS